MSDYEIDRVGLEALVAAIVKQAVYDWKRAMGVLRRKPDCGEAIRHRIECEKFFESGYFYELTGLDGTKILNRLKKEFDHVR